MVFWQAISLSLMKSCYVFPQFLFLMDRHHNLSKALSDGALNQNLFTVIQESKGNVS